MKTRIVIIALSMAAPALAAAQSPDTTTLSAVVISASKTPSSRSSLTQPVTVISGEELRARGITRVSDALRLVPGAAMVQNGSVGS
ncbi:MAG TPA: TonB-dependent receptor plug domain-containing protein, partial [Gemmatimonadaceae bacterium]|nr:TonB-dependent receptor plug domain-containing protein [Gemmatimonadaceae bacterium]